MINYYFFRFVKKKSGPDRNGTDRPVRGGPTPGGQRWDEFDFSEFGPPRTVPSGPYRTVNRPNPWTAQI
jgi:hypothetical protein